MHIRHGACMSHGQGCTGVVAVIVLATSLGACSSSSSTEDTDPPSASTPLAAPTTASASPTPLCANREPPPWVGWATFPADGPDPQGRIFFGQFARSTDVLGQVVGPLLAIDPDGSDVVQVLDCEIERPRVSPDGTRLAFSIVMDNGAWQVATADVDGSDLRVLTSTPGSAETPDWSPDGSWLIYSHASQPCPTESMEDCVLKDGVRYSLWRSSRCQRGRPSSILP